MVLQLKLVVVPVLTGMSKPAVEWGTSSEIMDKIHQKEYCTGGTVLKTEYTGFIKLFSFPLVFFKSTIQLETEVETQRLWVVYYSC